jgi:molecular chaperone GrpE (heat shock protein)
MRLIQGILPALTGFLGVFVGGWISGRHLKQERKHKRIREQLEGFYSPMLGMRLEIRAKSELRVKISSMADAAWQESVARLAGNYDAIAKLEKNTFPEFEKVIQYDEQQLRGELIPMYERMVQHFSSHLWLAEPSTRAFYGDLVEYVEIWNRFLKNTIPREVLKKIEHSEGKFNPFYDDLVTQMEKLQKALTD